MAPFVDLNADGIYNALDGDFPKIKGEQALWWVFNDQLVHGTGSTPIGVEVHAMAYACNSLSSLQNVTYYDFQLNYFGSSIFQNARVSIYNDIDLGYAFDDYIACDTSRRMAIGYNGNATDPVYGTNLTQTACILLKVPADSIGYTAPLGSYTYFNNLPSGTIGNPTTAADYSNYMRSKWKDGAPYTDTCLARGSANPVHYVYPSEPNDPNGISERNCMNTPHDRRFILSSSDFDMIPNQKYELTFAYINTPIGTSNVDFSYLKSMADTVKMYSDGCSSPGFPLAVNQQNTTKNIDIYPNPVNTKIHFNTIHSMNLHITTLNSLGQIVFPTQSVNSTTTLDVTSLSQGIYFLKIETENGEFLFKKFQKQ